MDRPILVNNTIVNNGPFGIQDGQPTIVNSIIWGHGDDLNASVSYVSFSNIGDGEYGGLNNNISSPPHFVNPSQGDYHLLQSSPGIDAGDNTDPDLRTTDIDGDPRIINGVVDMGADEFVGPLRIDVRANANQVAAGSRLTYTITITNINPFSISATVTETLPAHVTPSGTLIWQPTISGSYGVWTQTVSVTVQPDFEGILTIQLRPIPMIIDNQLS